MGKPRCSRCEDTGFRWRVPDGFNPFSAGGWNTMKAMYRVPCACDYYVSPASGPTQTDDKVES